MFSCHKCYKMHLRVCASATIVHVNVPPYLLTDVLSIYMYKYCYRNVHTYVCIFFSSPFRLCTYEMAKRSRRDRLISASAGLTFAYK